MISLHSSNTVIPIYLSILSKHVLFYGAGELEAPPKGWKTLCPDTGRVVLGKLSPRELALVAPTCRQFHGEFLVRAVEEQARLVSVAEATYGKERFSGLVRALQQFMLSWEPYPGLRYDKNCLVINASGGIELVTKVEAFKRHAADGQLLRIRRSLGGKKNYKYEVEADLWRNHPAGYTDAGIRIHLLKSRRGKKMRLKVIVDQGVPQEGLGFLVALCTGLPTNQASPLVASTLAFYKVQRAGKGQLEDWVGPLRRLAESFECYGYTSSVPHPFGKGKVDRAHPLGHLQLIWYDLAEEWRSP
jgi:hypothetical protein